MKIKIMNDDGFIKEKNNLELQMTINSKGNKKKFKENRISKNKLKRLSKKYKEDVEKIFNFKSITYNQFIIRHSKENEKYNNMIRAVSYIETDSITSVIIINNKYNLFKRVFVHEYMHCYRISYLNIKKDVEYIKYLSNINNWVYEEILALVCEKTLNRNLSWEKIVGFEYNTFWYHFNNVHIVNLSFLKDIINSNNLAKWMKENNFDETNMGYYIAYYICKNLDLDKKQIKYRLINQSAENGWKLILDC